jgi:hypothetical protein
MATNPADVNDLLSPIQPLLAPDFTPYARRYGRSNDPYLASKGKSGLTPIEPREYINGFLSTSNQKSTAC